jgi:hypothetical protein
MYAQNNLLDEAKKELIDVIYANDVAPEKKASALYLLGNINVQQGHSDAAAKAFVDLARRYPNSPEAKTAAGITSQAAVSVKTPAVAPKSVDLATSGIRLINRGSEPRYTLRYSLDTSEEIHLALRGTMLDSDCPTEPSKVRYPSADVDVVLTASPLSDSTMEVTHMRLGMTVSGSTPGKNGAIDHMEPVHIDMPVHVSATGKMLDDLPPEMDQLSGMQSFGSTVPTESVGVGAQWEVSAPIEMREYPATAKLTYTVISMNASSAQLRVSAEFDGSYAEGDSEVRIEGRGIGETQWRAGHVIANAMSLTAFARIIEMRNGHDLAGGKTACLLLAMQAEPPN